MALESPRQELGDEDALLRERHAERTEHRSNAAMWKTGLQQLQTLFTNTRMREMTQS